MCSARFAKLLSLKTNSKSNNIVASRFWSHFHSVLGSQRPCRQHSHLFIVWQIEVVATCPSLVKSSWNNHPWDTVIALTPAKSLLLLKSYWLFNIFIFMPLPFEEWWRGIKCYPCPCVRACVRPCVRPLSKFGVRSITFERLHRFNSNLVCWYIISKHRSSSIWVTIH